MQLAQAEAKMEVAQEGAKMEVAQTESQSEAGGKLRWEARKRSGFW
jgi:hypothetical protein